MKYIFIIGLLFTACARTPSAAERREFYANRNPAAAARGLMVRCDLSVYRYTEFDLEKRTFKGTMISQKDQHFGSYFQKFDVNLESFGFHLQAEEEEGSYSAHIQSADNKIVTSDISAFPARLLLADTEAKIYAELNCAKE